MVLILDRLLVFRLRMWKYAREIVSGCLLSLLPNCSILMRPNLVEDNLIFLLESGVQQKVNLNAYSWDAEFLKDKIIAKGVNEVFSNQGKPIVVYGGIKVDSTATLTIKPGVKLYFHENAGLDVYGTLNREGEKRQRGFR